MDADVAVCRQNGIFDENYEKACLSHSCWVKNDPYDDLGLDERTESRDQATLWCP